MSEEPKASPEAQLLGTINQLLLKAMHAKGKRELTFTILNDTIRALRYDRAVLWSFEQGKPELVGVSGHHVVKKEAATAERWRAAISKLPNPKVAARVTPELLGSDELWKSQDLQPTTVVFWLPIFCDERLLLGLWLEMWDAHLKQLPTEEHLKLLQAMLLNGYGEAWGQKQGGFSRFGLRRNQAVYYAAIAVVVALLVIRVPLRIVAPCEVIPTDPYIVTAPLQGIVDQVVVVPGQKVIQGETLLQYDKRAPLQQLEAARKEVEITQAEERRAATLGLNDPKSRAELAIVRLKLQKAQGALDFAEFQAGRLTVPAPQDGIVMVQQPDMWRGKPVELGERILSINDPVRTKVRFWIPEDDNIDFDSERPLRVFLNVLPSSSYAATIQFISSESGVDAKGRVTFLAEAEWTEPPQDVKLGLKGSAILYGHRVSLGYYIIRRPWSHLRYLLGV